jgi:outer membrane protein TolC
VGVTLIPTRSVVLNQGGQTFVTSGTSLTQPLVQLLRVKSANDIAFAELMATRDKERQTENTIALGVHQLYYRILVAQAHREATRLRPARWKQRHCSCNRNCSMSRRETR